MILNDYLQHHGIKRQRWGVRRFQNYDGSLTDAGRERAKMHTKNASSAKRFDSGRYSNESGSPTYLGRQKFDIDERKRKRHRAAKLRADTVMIFPISNRAVSRGMSVAI